MSNQTFAVLYEPDGFQTQGKRLLGRQAAGEGFLKGLVQYGRLGRLGCVSRTKKEFLSFCRQVMPWTATPREAKWFPSQNLQNMGELGVLYRPDPLIGDLAWQRRYGDERAYSLCGITHTIASKAVQKGLGDLLIAPVTPWDAVICTSYSVKRAVETLLEDWADYLRMRLNAEPRLTCQLPVIPLGIDTTLFPQPVRQPDLRASLRQQMNIPPDDMVVLFVGRLIFYAKAHPVSMYLALEQAARLTRQKIHFVQVGWFENEQEEQAFKAGAQTFCPSVRCLFIDGRLPEIRANVWSMADLFLSLSDNIQETFGLTPLEAMANGLPVIVSDWDGYRETVRHGIDGFRIPTTIPAGRPEDASAKAYFSDEINYSMFIAQAALATAVDIQACVQALVTLIHQPALREKMGAAGRERVRHTYDWKVVIPQYEALWQELNQIRLSEITPTTERRGQPPYPLLSNPFHMYKHYATNTLSADKILTVPAGVSMNLLERIEADWMAGFGKQHRLPSAVMTKIMERVQNQGSCAVEEMEQSFSADGETDIIQRTLVYLLKWGVLQIRNPNPGIMNHEK